MLSHSSDLSARYDRHPRCGKCANCYILRAKIAVTGTAMIEAEIEYGATPELTADMIRAQLDLLVRDEVFRSSKRSVAFLKYVVEQTLNGSADQIKERTIGVEVFGRDPVIRHESRSHRPHGGDRTSQEDLQPITSTRSTALNCAWNWFRGRTSRGSCFPGRRRHSARRTLEANRKRAKNRLESASVAQLAGPVPLAGIKNAA